MAMVDKRATHQYLYGVLRVPKTHACDGHTKDRKRNGGDGQDHICAPGRYERNFYLTPRGRLARNVGLR